MNIALLLANSARTFPERPAVSGGREVRWRYGELLRRAAALAGGLRDGLKLQPGDRLGLAMKNCPEYIEALWASWLAGLCVVPINAKLHQREFAYILGHSGCRTCVVTPDLADTLMPLTAELPGLETIVCVDDDSYRRLCRGEPLPMVDRSADSPAWLFYTSGTTGRPKGATLTHGNLLAMTLRYYPDVDQVNEHDCMIHAAPLSHGGGIYSLPHIAQASNQIIPDSGGFDPAEIFDLLAHYPRVTAFAAPTMLMRLVHHPAARSAKVENWRTIFYGGAPMYVPDLKLALDRFGPCLWQNYGQGESPCTIAALSKAMHADRAHPDWERRLGTVGIARTGVEIGVFDGDDRMLPAGEVGEIVARSEVTMAGYWNDPEATAHTLRGGWLHTGDIGCLSDDGFLTLKDRSKDLIISGGSNIYPREVEEVLLLAHGVREVSVVGRPHPDWGEEVVAFVVATDGVTLAEAELDAYCLNHIARFKRPKSYRIVESLPKNNYGKVLKTALRDQLAAETAAMD